jgi:hypothetical protein
MYNIYDSVFLNAGEGVQDFKIFYDTLFLNTKIINDTEYLNILLIEPFKYNFENSSFSSGGEGILINFGNTFDSSPLKSNGNTVVDYLLDDPKKIVFIVGLSSCPDYTIPIIYSYNLNTKSLIKTFPSETDITDWNGFNNYTFVSTQTPFIKKGNGLTVGFKTLSAGQYYLNLIEFNTNTNKCYITNYNMLEIPDLNFTGFNEQGLIYKMGNDYGILEYK